jgi:hypothetical protein
MGPIEMQRPKLRGTDEAFCSQLFGTGVTRTNALEALVIAGWVRGLSDREGRGGSCGGALTRGRPVSVHGLPDLPEDPDRVRGLADPFAGRRAP